MIIFPLQLTVRPEEDLACHDEQDKEEVYFKKAYQLGVRRPLLMGNSGLTLPRDASARQSLLAFAVLGLSPNRNSVSL